VFRAAVAKTDHFQAIRLSVLLRNPYNPKFAMKSYDGGTGVSPVQPGGDARRSISKTRLLPMLVIPAIQVVIG